MFLCKKLTFKGCDDYGRPMEQSRPHHIFILSFVVSFYLLSFFPRLISAAADWMCAILSHMVWPYCEFKMQA